MIEAKIDVGRETVAEVKVMALEWMVVGLIKSMEGPDLPFLRAAIYRV